jgi:hypothetical protein
MDTEATLETATETTPEIGTDATQGTAQGTAPETAPKTALEIAYQTSLTATALTEAMATDATTTETTQQPRRAKPGRQTTRRSTPRNRFQKKKAEDPYWYPGKGKHLHPTKMPTLDPTIPSHATQSVHRASGVNRRDSVTLVTKPGTSSGRVSAMLLPMVL